MMCNTCFFMFHSFPPPEYVLRKSSRQMGCRGVNCPMRYEPLLHILIYVGITYVEIYRYCISKDMLKYDASKGM